MVWFRAVGVVLCCGLLASGCLRADQLDGRATSGEAPQLSPLPGSVQVNVGGAVDLTVSARSEVGAVSLHLESGPPGASFIASGGVGRFYWEPLASDLGMHDVVLVAMDERGGRASARVEVSVDAASGAPRFAIGPQVILDLTRDEALDVEVAILDEDSTEVAATLWDAPRGMALEPMGAGLWRLTWRPDEAQRMGQAVWSVTLVADDGDHAPTLHELTVAVITKQGCREACGCQPPTISHIALSDQRGVEDFPVQAWITDAESAVHHTMLFWTDGDPDDLQSYRSLDMTASDDRYLGVIPNPFLAPGQEAHIAYFICAMDDDDAAGDACDNHTCLPLDGVFGFTVRHDGPGGVPDPGAEEISDPEPPGDMTGEEPDEEPEVEPEPEQEPEQEVEPEPEPGMEPEPEPGMEPEPEEEPEPEPEVDPEPEPEPDPGEVEPPEPGCDDALEPNDVLSEATPLEPGSVRDLSICAGGDLDVFTVEVEAGDVLIVALTFVHAQGDLDVGLYDPTGERLLAQATSTTDDETLVYQQFEAAGAYVVAVAGYQEAANTYQLDIEVERDFVCHPDASEPSDSPAQAPVLAPDTVLTDHTACLGDNDYYRVELEPGDALSVTLGSSLPEADLDLLIIDPQARTILDASQNPGSAESVSVVATERGGYIVKVFASEGAVGPYGLSVSVVEGP